VKIIELLSTLYRSTLKDSKETLFVCSKISLSFYEFWKFK
jgi:hypothetical protein